jgi:hypothetical protein
MKTQFLNRLGKQSLIATAMLMIAGVGLPATAQVAQPTSSQPIDIFYTPNGTSIFWQTLTPNPATGSATGVENGFIGPFEHPCATLRTGNRLYVVDSRSAGVNAILVHVFAESGGKVLTGAVIPLMINGDSKATCQIGANNGYVYVSTNKSPVFAISKQTHAVSLAPTAVTGPATSIVSNDNLVAINQTISIPGGPTGPTSSLLDVNNTYIANAAGPVIGVGEAGRQ